MSTNPKPPTIMTIAGSDPSGGAGIQADLKTFTALQCYGASVITALTAQNTVRVQAVHAPPSEFVGQQLRSVLDDMDINAFKTGMLVDAAITHVVASTLESFYRTSDVHFRPLIVVDPVCVSTSGHTLLETSALQVMIKELFPLATIITPNKSEAELLLSLNGQKTAITSLEDALKAAEKLGQIGGGDILLKGGHLVVSPSDIETLMMNRTDIAIEWTRLEDENMEILRIGRQRDESLVIDILYQSKRQTCTIFARPRVDSSSTHGTGCTLSAALACYLGRGLNVREAVKLAIDYTHIGIETAFPLGNGHGPLNHLHPISYRLIPPATKSNPYPLTKALIQSNAKIWKEYVQHPFVKQLGEGTLSKESFIHFIKQDYQYLKYYSRAYGILAAKSRSFTAIGSAVNTIQHIIREVSMHISYCAEWGIDETELESTPESPATTAYGAYLLDVGIHGDEGKLVVALAACLLGYGEVGLWLKAEAAVEGSKVKLVGNPYLKWIEDYSGADYQDAVKLGIDILEANARNDPPSERRYGELKDVWDRCTRLEKGFWDMAISLT